MDWNDIRFILAICRIGTLSGAARELGVNHSTVFRRIDAIEKKLEVRLFERHSSGYAMTEAGEAALEAGERIENEVLGLSRKLVGRDLNLRGIIRVAAPDALLVKILMPYIRDFSQRFPEIQLELVTSNNYMNLSKREADLAIRVTQSPPDTAIGHRICSMNSAIYASNEYLSNHRGSNLDDYSWLMPDESLAHLPFTEWLKKNHPKAKKSLYCNTLPALHEAALQHIGIVSLPCFLADTDTGLKRISDPVAALSSELWLLTHPDLRRTARIKALMDFLIASLEKEKGLIEGRMLV